MTDSITPVAVIIGVGVYLAKTLYEQTLKKKDDPELACHFTDPEISKLRTFEISREVSDTLMPEMRTQTRILSEIRDAVRQK